MVNKMDILITTTSTIEGHEIIKYVKPITAHIVIGTNVFSDIMASWTDFLGGQSETYQKKLSESYQLALKDIKSNAFQLGANAVVGLSIDLDEISGKGKSMFMITASGTAVLINSKTSDFKSQGDVKNTIIAKEDMSIYLQKKNIKYKIETNTLILDNNLWQFITDSRYFEIAEDIIKVTIKGYDNSNNQVEYLNKLKSYLYALPEDEIKELLYRIYLEGKYKNYIIDLVFDVIQHLGIFDSTLLTKELENLVPERKYRILKLITVAKQFYTKDDIQEFRKIQKLIKDKFPITVEFTTKKRLLSDKEDSIWICSCKSKNDLNLINCQSCGSDKYGFKQNSIGPVQANDYLDGCIEFMEKI